MTPGDGRVLMMPGGNRTGLLVVSVRVPIEGGSADDGLRRESPRPPVFRRRGGPERGAATPDDVRAAVRGWLEPYLG
jgi:hypothetical protein